MQSAFANHLGRTFSLFAGLVHLIWAVLSWLGWAKPVVAWVYGMHGLTPNFTVTTLSPARGIELIILTLILGSIVGFVLGAIWEKTSK